MEVRFAKAARHSRMVRILRVAVPAAVVLSMAAHNRNVSTGWAQRLLIMAAYRATDRAR